MKLKGKQRRTVIVGRRVDITFATEAAFERALRVLAQYPDCQVVDGEDYRARPRKARRAVVTEDFTVKLPKATTYLGPLYAPAKSYLK